MEYSPPEAESSILKEAMTNKKESHRNEIRRRNLQFTLKSKRLNTFGMSQHTLSSTTNSISSINEMGLSSDSTLTQHPASSVDFSHEITLETYIAMINHIVSSTDDLSARAELSDRVLRCLNVLQSHVLMVIQEKDVARFDAGLEEFIRLGGCPCILQFLQAKYLSTPEIILSAVSTIANIYTLTDKPILSFLLQNGVSYYTVHLLSVITEMLSTSLQQPLSSQSTLSVSSQPSTQKLLLLLSEVTRTLANMTGESYEYRMDLISKGVLNFITSDMLVQLMQSGMSTNLVEQLLFLVKNMVAEKPTIDEEYKAKLIPVIVRLFLLCTESTVPLEAVQDAILAVKSFAMYGNTIIRAKMIANRQVFEKMIDLADGRKNTDTTNVYLALQTIQDYMRYSERQAQFLFNMKDAEFLDTLNWTVGEGKVVDLQIAAVEVVCLYIQYDNTEHFDDVFNGSFLLIQQIVFTAMYHPNHTLKLRAKEFVVESLAKANIAQLAKLFKEDSLCVIMSILNDEEDAAMKVKALVAIRRIFELYENDDEINNENNSDRIEDGSNAAEEEFKRILVTKLGFEQTLNQILSDPNINQQLFDVADDILEEYLNR